MDKKEIANKHLGWFGRMISGSKSGYMRRYAMRMPVFNANIICVDGDGVEKIWHGDIDLTEDEQKILDLQKELHSTIYVLREMDARFENEDNPRLERCVYKTDGASVEINYTSKGFVRDSNGKLKQNLRSINEKVNDAIFYMRRMYSLDDVLDYVKDDNRKTVVDFSKKIIEKLKNDY
jgi:hypothetical protein